MKIDKCKVAFSIKLDPKVVREAALRYPDKTVLDAFFIMGVLNVR
jgi:hypothetical protein